MNDKKAGSALRRALPAALLVLGLGCDPGSADRSGGQEGAGSQGAWFMDATAELGIDFFHAAGAPGNYFMPEVIGSGGALFDFDGDGRLDIYLVHNGGSESEARNQLYRQGADGRFTDVSRGSGLDVGGRGMGVAVGDVNNDSRPDILLTEYGRARLFAQRTDGNFDDVTSAAGIDNPAWGTSASFLDADRDGWLDLIIANYVVYSPTRPCSDQAGRRDYCGPAPFPGTPARLFRNTGAGTTSPPVFQDVSLASGIGRLAGPGLGVAGADFSGDRWPDILVANDGKPNFLWVNRRDGTFEEDAILRGLAFNGMGQAQADMGIALGDTDGDGLIDIFITHLGDEQHLLLKQGPVGQFLDATGPAGLAAPEWRSTGFGTLFGDFDLDGDLDLALANGRVKFAAGPSPPGASFWDAYRERNQLFANDGTGRFTDVSSANPAFCGWKGISRGLASGDIDEDGDLDLLVTCVADRARLMRNVAARQGNWLRVRAVDSAAGGRDAHGAEVTVLAGGRRWVQVVQPSLSYLTTSDPRLHFGLGSLEVVEAIEVFWPQGSTERFPGSSVNRGLVLRRGEGRPGGEAPPR